VFDRSTASECDIGATYNDNVVDWGCDAHVARTDCDRRRSLSISLAQKPGSKPSLERPSRRAPRRSHTLAPAGPIIVPSKSRKLFITNPDVCRDPLQGRRKSLCQVPETPGKQKGAKPDWCARWREVQAVSANDLSSHHHQERHGRLTSP